MAKTIGEMTAGLPVVTLPPSDKGKLIDERRESRCLSLKWCLLTACCSLLAVQLLAVLVTVLLNWGSALDGSDVTTTTSLPLRTQIPAPDGSTVTPTPDPGRVGNGAGEGNTTSRGRLLLVLLAGHQHRTDDTESPQRPLPTSPARYMSDNSTSQHTPHGKPSDTREDNALPRGALLKWYRVMSHGRQNGNETSTDTARERSRELLALLRRLHGLHHITSRNMHRQATDDVTRGAEAATNDVTGGTTADRSRREAGEELKKAKRSAKVWPRRLENIGTH
ncbi:uncharacterized protein LOC122374433 [Amphibalanus amphitrite]|uniref:uncharacterized protein LOC122374433 n=1 Tax=Amphibalanus amphitrite TaxID=1232801 RepID=UPI001C90AF5D|nr:uncharacterized protein LOC122374433 [Amphibalanus amphitrite]